MTDYEKRIVKKFNDAMDNAEAAVERAETCGFAIEGAHARASNLALDCQDMDRAAPKPKEKTDVRKH